VRSKNENLTVYVLSSLFVMIMAMAAQRLAVASSLAQAYCAFAFLAVCALDFRRTRDCQEVVFAPVMRQRGIYLNNGVLQVAPIGDYVEEWRPVAAHGFTFTDRCLGYLFVAPLLLPGELYRLVRDRN